MLVKQSSTAFPLLFLMVDSSDHITGKTGLTPTVTISKGGGAFASPAGAVTELSGGWYKIAGNATDTGTLGQVVIHATATGADPCDDKSYEVVAFDPQSATNLGLSTLTGNVPQTGDAYAVVSNATYGNAKLVRSTTPANALAVNASGYLLGVIDVFGSVVGNVGGMVLGGGDSEIVGVGAWVMNNTGVAVAPASATTAIQAKTDQLTFTTANQVDSNVIVKTGFALGSTGLDAIPTTAPTGVAATFREMVVALWRRTFKKTTLTASQLKTFADDGTTVLTTQTVADDGTTQSHGNAA